jgi:hypothetical protein
MMMMITIGKVPRLDVVSDIVLEIVVDTIRDVRYPVE